MRRLATVALVLALAGGARATVFDLPGEARGSCAAWTKANAWALLRYAGVTGPLRRPTVMLCDTADGGVVGIAVMGSRVCTVRGVLDGACITLSACGAVGPPLC